MSDTVRQRVIDAAVAELVQVPGLAGARHDYPWDVFEQNLPYAWIYDAGEQPRHDEEHGNIVAQLTLTIDVAFEVDSRGGLLREGNRILGLIQAQIGAALDNDDPQTWGQLRRLTEYFDETENDIQELPNERGAFLGALTTTWTGTYVRSYASPYAEG